MYRSIQIMLMAMCVFLSSCSKERNQPADSKATTSSTASADNPKTAKESRKYRSMPESLRASPQPAVPTAWSEWSLMQVALTEGSLDEAIKAYGRIKAGSPQEHRLRASAALQLTNMLLGETPPNIEKAKPLLKELKDSRDAWGSDAGLGSNYEYLEMIADLADGRGLISSGAAEFSEGARHIVNHAVRCSETPADAQMLLHAFDHLLGSVASKEGESADRLESIIAALQISAAWRSPELLRALQERRVQLLLDAKRPADALFECRVLLALSLHNAREWRAALGKIAAIMPAAGRDSKDIDSVSNYQKLGEAGADRQKGTPDDAMDPLKTAKRDVVKPWSQADALLVPPKQGAIPPQKVDDSICAAVKLLLVGKADEATDCLHKLSQSTQEIQNRQVDLSLDYLAMAQALADGNALQCERWAMDLATGQVKATTAASKLWRYEAIQYLLKRETFLLDLVNSSRFDLALGMCRAMANGNRLEHRKQSLAEAAWKACTRVASSDKGKTALQCYLDYGKTLTSPQARIRQVRLATKQLKGTGDEAAVISITESLKDIWGEASRDPDFMLLHLSCLVRLGRISEALPEIKQLCERSDLSNESSWRAQLLLSVAYMQEGKLAPAREALRHLLDENPTQEYRDRANTILRNIMM